MLISILAHEDEVVIVSVDVDGRSLCFSGVSVKHLVDVRPYLAGVETIVHKP